MSKRFLILFSHILLPMSIWCRCFRYHCHSRQYLYYFSFSSSVLYARFYFCNPIMYKYMYIIELCANFVDRISPYKCKHMYIKLTVLLGTCYTQRIVKPIFERFVWMWKRGNGIDSDSNISNSNINGDGHACHHFFPYTPSPPPFLPGCYSTTRVG